MSEYSSIPEPIADPESLRQSVLALKQAVESLTGQRGGAKVRAATSTDVSSALQAEVAARDQAISEAVGSIDLSGYVNKTTKVVAGTGLSGGGELASDVTLGLADTPVTPGVYTNADIEVDAQGRVVSAASGAPGYEVRSAVKPSDTARSSDTTITDDPHLTLPVEASTTYIVEALLFYTAGGGNIQLGVSGPSGATGLVLSESFISPGTGPAVALGAATGAAGANSTIGTQGCALRAYVTTGANSGNVAVMWNRQAASGTTTARAGSYMKLIKVAA